jgi:hypothetical protein
MKFQTLVGIILGLIAGAQAWSPGHAASPLEADRAQPSVTSVSNAKYDSGLILSQDYRIGGWEVSCWTADGEYNCVMAKAVEGLGAFRIALDANTVKLSRAQCQSRNRWIDQIFDRKKISPWQLSLDIHNIIYRESANCDLDKSSEMDFTKDAVFLIARATRK